MERLPTRLVADRSFLRIESTGEPVGAMATKAFHGQEYSHRLAEVLCAAYNAQMERIEEEYGELGEVA